MNECFKKLYSKKQMDFYKVVEKNLEKEKKMFIITANPETFNIAENNNDFKSMLLDKEVTLVPDGIGIVKAANMLDYKIEERITGIDLANFLLDLSNKKKYKMALLGASKEVMDQLIKVIGERYPNIKLVKTENGYTSKKDEFFEELEKKDVDVCLVALGIPMQEELIYKHLKGFKKGIFVGVGGSFDVISGSKKRAPKIFIKTNTEWLYRIICEPKRIKRFWNNNVKFIFKIRKVRKNNENNK